MNTPLITRIHRFPPVHYYIGIVMIALSQLSSSGHKLMSNNHANHII